MEVHPVTRWSGTAFVLAGVSLALWPALHPWDQITGAHPAQSTAWLVSHTCHFLAGFFALLGLAGLAARPGTAATRLGAAAWTAAFTGAALFAATGVFTAFLWPTVAAHAPALVEVSGPFFSPPHPLIGISTVLFCGGFLLLAAALRRAGVLSLPAGATLAAGSLLLLVPPSPISPAPWPLFVAAGVVFGAGLAQLGLALRRRPASADATAPARAALA
ncbi:MAG TPA: hypothetical protein VHG08_00430 [Longimicrobium sp.]|nr:hypothetical protein [Longimicrobium sp.]